MYAVKVFFDDRPAWKCWVAQLADNTGMFGKGESQDEAVDDLVASINRHVEHGSLVYDQVVDRKDLDVTIQ